MTAVLFFFRHEDFIFLGGTEFRRISGHFPLDGGVRKLVDGLLGSQGEVARLDVVPEVELHYIIGNKWNHNLDITFRQ